MWLFIKDTFAMLRYEIGRVVEYIIGFFFFISWLLLTQVSWTTKKRK